MISFDLEPLEGPLSPAYSAIAPPSSLCHPGSSTMTDGDFEAWGLLTENQANHGMVKETATRRPVMYVLFAWQPVRDYEY